MKSLIFTIWNRIGHFSSMLIFLALGMWFKYLEVTIVPKYHLGFAMDKLIPFVPIFVVPYLFWFAYIAWGFVYFGFKSKDDFYKLSIFIYTSTAIACIIYALFPHGQTLRPNLAGENGFFVNIIKYIYLTDTPTNCLPSMHVLNSLAVNSTIRHSKIFENNVWVRSTSEIITILVCLSTVLIKQHSYMDVLAAFLIGLILEAIIFKVPLKQAKEQIA